ncbi:MAG: energy transducer TonB, partial [bacterium]|nr:energy transducer TonB [bacterium]
LLIGTDGHVRKADVAKSSGFEDLDEAAVEAAKQFIFTPAVAPGGKAVPVWVMYPVVFTLGD